MTLDMCMENQLFLNSQQIKAEDDEPNMDDRTTGSTKGVAISPSIEPGRASGGSLASLESSSNRRGSAISVIHVRCVSAAFDSIQVISLYRQFIYTVHNFNLTVAQQTTNHMIMLSYSSHLIIILHPLKH